MRTQYMRVAFQIPFDATVRVSLDTNLCMISERTKETINGMDICDFIMISYHVISFITAGDLLTERSPAAYVLLTTIHRMFQEDLTLKEIIRLRES